MIARSIRCLTLVLLLVASAAPARAQQLQGDSMTFRNRGSTLQARYYRATRSGPAPTVLLVHGFPGTPDDMLGLGPALSAAGWNVLFYNPRGFHRSEGTYTLPGGLEDAAAALQLLRDSAAGLRVDTGHVAVLGYSHGGWVALMTAIRGEPLRCVGAVAPDNLGLAGRRLDRDSAFITAMRQALESARTRGIVRMEPFDSTAAQMRAHRDDNDLTLHAAALAGRPVLIVGGWRDEGPRLDTYIVPLVRALRVASAHVTPVALDDDHGFRARRAELHAAVIDWLGKECAAPPPVRPAP